MLGLRILKGAVGAPGIGILVPPPPPTPMLGAAAGTLWGALRQNCKGNLCQTRRELNAQYQDLQSSHEQLFGHARSQSTKRNKVALGLQSGISILSNI